jgi:hypothetical protein
MKGFKLYIGIILAIIFLTAIAIYNQPKEIDWKITLAKEDKIPFGTYVLNQNINKLFPNQKINESRLDVYRLIKEDSTKNSQILIISKSFKIGKAEVERLVNWVEKGNKIFIAAYNIDDNFTNYFKLKFGFAMPDENVDLKFTNPILNKEKYIFTKNSVNIFFINRIAKNQTSLAKDGNGNTNFIAINLKKGAIYVCPNPLIFSNYNLIDTKNRKVASNMLSYLSAKKPLILTNYYLYNSVDNESILTTLFKFTELKWAYYIALITLIIYILANVKRKQRAIPVVTPLQNTSLNFVSTIAQIYFQQKDHTQLTQKKIYHFLEFVKQKYRLQQNNNIQFIEQLSAKSGVDEEVVTKIIILSEKIKKKQTITEIQLIEISNLIDKFYGNAV